MSPAHNPAVGNPEPIQPARISPDDFNNHVASWQTLATGPAANLQNIFRGLDPKSEKLVNYVYLPNNLLIELLSAVGTVSIRTQLAVKEAQFSLVLFGVDACGNPTSGYYLAGQTGIPALLPVCGDQVAFDLVETWIMNWHKEQVSDLGETWFETSYKPAPLLLGYTYLLSDYLTALMTMGSKEGSAENPPALLLAFGLHQYARPGATDASPLFGLVVTLGPEPVNGKDYLLPLSADDYYYDVSKPCPPVCGPGSGCA